MIVWVQLAELLPIIADSFASFPDCDFASEILGVLLENLSVVGIPGAPGVQKIWRSCCHDSGKGEVSDVLVAV
jgi:hypothetical protein